MLLGKYGRTGLFLRAPDGVPGGGAPGNTPPAGTGVQTPLTPGSPPIPAAAPPVVGSSEVAFQSALAGTGNQAPGGQQDWQQMFASMQTRMDQVINTANEERERRAGLDRRYSHWEEQLTNLGAQVQQLAQAVGGGASQGGQPSNSQPNAQTPTRASAPVPDETQALRDELNQMRAEQGRARAIRQASRDFPNVNLIDWEENIPLHADAEAQLQAVRSFAERLQGQTTGAAQAAADQRQQALTQGMTPGSSPAPQAPGDPRQQEFQEIWALMNDPARWSQTSAEERNRMEERFDELTPEFGHTVGGGFTTPWSSTTDLQRMVADLSRQVSGLQQGLAAGTPAPT